MFRRRQPALIASLAAAAAAGLVAPAVVGVPIQQASAASQAAAAGVVSPAVSAGARFTGLTSAVANVAADAVASSEEEPEAVEEPSADSADESTTATTVPPPAEPVESTTTTTSPAAEPTTTTAPPTTTIPEPPAESTTTTAPPVDDPTCDATTDPSPDSTVPADPTCETTTTTTTTTTIAPDDEVTEPATTTTVPPTTDPVADPEPTDPPSTTTPSTAPSTTPTATPTATPTPESAEEPVAPTTPAPADDDGESTGDERSGEPETADRLGTTVAVTAPLDPNPIVATHTDPSTPIDTTPAELNTYDPGLRASSYDGVYAEGVPVGVAMATTRWLESRNRYNAQARGSSASGAYQVIDSTWGGYGGYPRAVLAPPEVQDQFAYESFTALLKRHGNDVSRIPVIWYIGHVPQGEEWDTIPRPDAGNVLTPRQYQAIWMKKFFSLLTEGAPVYLPSDTEELIPAIAFPVLGPVEFVDDWHFDRDGGARRHEGLDLLGYEGQPIRAVFDGVITRIDDVPSGIAGNGLRLTRDDGLYANYFHLSNSETGPVHASLEVGTRVRAGQIIGFMGSTGNAGIPHLHFELRTAEREPMAPYPAVMEAVQREQCTVGLGPWSTEFTSPAEQAEAEAAVLAALADLTPEQIAGLPNLPEAPADEVERFVVEGPDGAQWVIGSDGSVTASGQAAMIGSYQADCPMPVDTTDEQGVPISYGTDAGGLAIDELPVGWWDDEAVEWTPELDEGAEYVDPWELDQADLDAAGLHHVEHDADAEVSTAPASEPK